MFTYPRASLLAGYAELATLLAALAVCAAVFTWSGTRWTWLGTALFAWMGTN